MVFGLAARSLVEVEEERKREETWPSSSRQAAPSVYDLSCSMPAGGTELLRLRIQAAILLNGNKKEDTKTVYRQL